MYILQLIQVLIFSNDRLGLGLVGVIWPAVESRPAHVSINNRRPLGAPVQGCGCTYDFKLRTYTASLLIHHLVTANQIPRFEHRHRVYHLNCRVLWGQRGNFQLCACWWVHKESDSAGSRNLSQKKAEEADIVASEQEGRGEMRFCGPWSLWMTTATSLGAPACFLLMWHPIQ